MRLGTAAVNQAMVVKLRAMRRLADVVDAGQAAGTIATAGGDPNVRTPGIARLEDLDVKRQRLCESRTIRDNFTDPDLVQLAGGKTERDEELSLKRLLRIARDLVAGRQRLGAVTLPVPTDVDIRYGCLWMDQPVMPRVCLRNQPVSRLNVSQAR